MKMKKKGLGKLKINVKAAEEVSEFTLDQDSDEFKIIDNGKQDGHYAPAKNLTCSFNFPLLASDTLRDEIRTKERNDDLIWIADEIYIANSATASNEEILK